MLCKFNTLKKGDHNVYSTMGIWYNYCRTESYYSQKPTHMKQIKKLISALVIVFFMGIHHPVAAQETGTTTNTTNTTDDRNGDTDKWGLAGLLGLLGLLGLRKRDRDDRRTTTTTVR